MKIIVCIRTLNESERIAKCCLSYAFADRILIADGGSTDNTKEIAKTFKNVRVRQFREKVLLKNGVWRNPDYKHLQFLFDWALQEDADWIVSQDCDQRPNMHLKRGARDLFASMGDQYDFLCLTQLYLWGKDKYFPLLSKPDGQWMQGLWGWRANINLKVIDKMPHFEFSYDGEHAIDINKTGRDLHVQPPYCYMHFGWETPEQTTKHIAYYRETGLIAEMIHPLQFGGRLEDLPEWAHE